MSLYVNPTTIYEIDYEQYKKLLTGICYCKYSGSRFLKYLQKLRKSVELHPAIKSRYNQRDLLCQDGFVTSELFCYLFMPYSGIPKYINLDYLYVLYRFMINNKINLDKPLEEVYILYKLSQDEE